MLTVHNISNAKTAEHYFAKDDYYTQEDGQGHAHSHSLWYGAGAKALGLSNDVDRDKFSTLLRGEVGATKLGVVRKDPDTGERMVVHRPGIDLTFSAPKSVSLLSEVAGNKTVRAIHDAAITQTLEFIEKELLSARVTSDGVTRREKTGKVLAALFRHNTSRDGDPQLHTHAVILNATLCKDGKWRSMSNDALYGSQKVLGAVYNSALAAGMEKAGYRLYDTDQNGNFEVEGVSREQVMHFSQRREAIAAALDARGIDMAVATPAQREAATLATRKSKTQQDALALKSEWEARAVAVGLDLDTVVARAEERTGERGGERPASNRGNPAAGASSAPGGTPPTSEQRATSENDMSASNAVEFAAAHLFEREIVVGREAFLKTAVVHARGRVSATEIMDAYRDRLTDRRLQIVGEGALTAARPLRKERGVVSHLIDARNTGPLTLDEGRVATHITSLERLQGRSLTAGQKESLITALISNDRYVAVQGLAGTGKTTMVRMLKEIAEHSGAVVRGMAPTGAAAKCLSQETGIETVTVALFLIQSRELGKAALRREVFDKADPPKPKELWVVDESSFVSLNQMVQLQRVASHVDAKILFLGDKLQLQAVEAGKPFENVQSAGIDMGFMSQINRQKTAELRQVVSIVTGQDGESGGSGVSAAALRQNGKAFDLLARQGRVVSVSGALETGILARVADDFTALSAEEREKTIVITPFNKERELINHAVRQALKANGSLSTVDIEYATLVNTGWTLAKQQSAQYYKAGQVVMFGRDYRSLGVKKGDYATVLNVSENVRRVTLVTDDQRTVSWEPKRYKHVEVYESEKRHLARGDLIRFTRSGEYWKNGQTAVITSCDERTVHLAIPGRQGAPLSLEAAALRHWDHAYARTIHSVQGVTKNRTLFVIPISERLGAALKSKEKVQKIAQIFGNRSFYVGVTRASHQLTVYTNNASTARDMVTGQQDKTSVVERELVTENGRGFER